MPSRKPRFSRRARIVTGFVAISAGALIVASLYGRPTDRAGGNGAAQAQSIARDAVMTVTVAPMQAVELPRTVTVNGSIFAWQEVIIAPEVGGYRVAHLNVDVGDHVKRGDVLVELSTALLEADVATKRGVLNQREAQRVNADAALQRAQSLASMNVLSQSDLDKLQSDALSAKAAVESAKADLEASTLRLKLTKVTAPDDGVITSRTVTVGQIAQAGVEMLRLLRDGRIEWRGEVPEARLSELRAGQRVKVTTADGATVDGKIRVVAPTVSSINRTGLVYVDLESASHLRPGMFARGEIETSRGMAFTVPLQSVVSADGYSYVFVLKPDHTVERRRVETGAVRDAAIEVTDGIASGDMIVDKGAGFLKDGDLVNVATTSGS